MDMTLVLNKIQRGFSRSADGYDRYSGLHRDIADRLLACVSKEDHPSAILDVGCGTGYLTGRIKEKFPRAKVIGLDFARGMLDVARGKEGEMIWVLGDANNLPFAKGSINALVSNLAYQWAGDLTHVFSEARRVLAVDGVLACTIFGYKTCQELFQSLDEAKNKSLLISRLPDEAQVREALVKGGFKNPKVERELIKIEFKSMQELLAWLKSIGANNLSREFFLGPEAILKAANIYRKKFSYLQGVGATFEVIQVYVKR